MLRFVPHDDLSESANEATGITSLDFGYIQVGESKSASFRVGNTSSNETDYALSFTADPTILIEVAPDMGTLGEDEISDTTTIVIAPDLDASSQIQSIDLIATDFNTDLTYRLEMMFTVVGVNEPRSSQYPERQTPFTDDATNVIVSAGEPFRLLRYDPIAFDPIDKRIIIDPQGKRNLLGAAGEHRWITQLNVAERLNPTNSDWGYTRTEENIIASFHDEENTTEVSFTRDNTMMTYTSTAFLVVPAEFEMLRSWALFAPAKGTELAQYKRTVYLVQRQADVWALHNIFPRYRGNELSHYEVELVQLHRQAMGSREFYNPFAFSYEFETDAPYAMFVTDFPDLFDSILSDDPSNVSGAVAFS